MLARFTEHKREIEMSKIEELEHELAQVRINHNETAQILVTMASQLVELKAEEVQDEEWPKYGDKYWASDSYTGKVFESAGADTQITQRRLAAGNVHRTREEAEAYRDWLTNPRTQARRRVEMCDGLYEYGCCELAISTDIDTYTEINIMLIRSGFHTGAFKFRTKYQAQACIDLLGEDVIKCALGVES